MLNTKVKQSTMKANLLLIAVFLILKVNAQCYRFVNAGNYQILALKSDNTLWGRGANYNGELGDGTYVVRESMSQIGTAADWSVISTGTEHTIAIKTDGTLWAWGSNSAGQLGDGTTVKKNVPIQIGNESDWQSVSTKGFTSFAIKSNGTLWGWGQNNVSNIGLGYFSINVSVPTQVGTENNWKSVVAGFDHTMAIKTDNTLWAWGSNHYGKIGVGNFSGNFLSPVQIGTDSNWKTIATGYHTLAIKNNGTLWAWGNNTAGELGDASNISKDVPVQIGTDTDWNTIAATIHSSYGIKNNGTLWTWGNNSNYEFGNGTTANSNTPILINNETNWLSISPRQSHEIALKTDFSVYYWGVNNNALPTTSATPVPLAIGCQLTTENFYASNEVIIFPNPSSQKIEIINNTDDEIVSVQFIDTVGKKILQHNTNFETIPIENLQTGLYTVIIYFKNMGFTTQKFIKK